jgi:heme-degrading monooxygenase HmoA
MIAVIFEVWTDGDCRATYLGLAAALKSELEAVDGFLSVERFQSLIHPEKLLSLSFWRDEAAVTTWRNLSRHREAQAHGRSGVFKDYRLRIANVSRDYGLHDRRHAPADSKVSHG